MFSNNIRNWLLAAFALLACAWAAPASAACAGGTCFVVAAGGNSATNTTWTLTSNGATCSCTPGATDAVILDSAAGQLTISGSFSVGTLDATGTGGSGSPYTSTVTHTANTIQINTAAANSFKLVPGMGWTSGASNAVTITFANTSGSAHITSAGKNFAAIVLNGVGGTVVQDDDLNITNATSNGTLTITNGIWDANGHATTASNFVSTGAASRTFKLGSSAQDRRQDDKHIHDPEHDGYAYAGCHQCWHSGNSADDNGNSISDLCRFRTDMARFGVRHQYQSAQYQYYRQ